MSSSRACSKILGVADRDDIDEGWRQRQMELERERLRRWREQRVSEANPPGITPVEKLKTTLADELARARKDSVVVEVGRTRADAEREYEAAVEFVQKEMDEAPPAQPSLTDEDLLRVEFFSIGVQRYELDGWPVELSSEDKKRRRKLLTLQKQSDERQKKEREKDTERWLLYVGELVAQEDDYSDGPPEVFGGLHASTLGSISFRDILPLFDDPNDARQAVEDWLADGDVPVRAPIIVGPEGANTIQNKARLLEHARKSAGSKKAWITRKARGEVPFGGKGAQGQSRIERLGKEESERRKAKLRERFER